MRTLDRIVFLLCALMTVSGCLSPQLQQRETDQPTESRRMVTVTGRFFLVDETSFQKSLAPNLTAHQLSSHDGKPSDHRESFMRNPHDKSGWVYDSIDERQLSEVLSRLKTSKQIWAPKMNIFDQFNGKSVLQNEYEYVSDYDVRTGKPVMGSIASGGVLEVKSTVSQDQKQVLLQVHCSLSMLDGFRVYQVPEVGEVHLPRLVLPLKMASSFQCPDGGGVILWYDGAGEVMFLRSTGKACRLVIILVPEIIAPSETMPAYSPF